MALQEVTPSSIHQLSTRTCYCRGGPVAPFCLSFRPCCSHFQSSSFTHSSAANWPCRTRRGTNGKEEEDVVICTAREPSYMTSPISIIRCKPPPLLYLHVKYILFVSKIHSACPKMIGISRPPHYTTMWMSYLDDPQIDSLVTTDNNKVAHVWVPHVQLLQYPPDPHVVAVSH